MNAFVLSTDCVNYLLGLGLMYGCFMVLLVIGDVMVVWFGKVIGFVFGFLMYLR